MYGQVYFHDFEIILQFLLCGSCICSSLLRSVGNSSVLHEDQESRGAPLGVKNSPQVRTPHLSAAVTASRWGECLMPLDTAPVENTAGIVKPSAFCSMAFHCNFTFLPSLKKWSFTFYRYFLTEKILSLIKKLFWKCLQFTPFLIILLSITFHSAIFFLVWSLESCLKMRALVFTTKNSAGKGILLGYGILPIGNF